MGKAAFLCVFFVSVCAVWRVDSAKRRPAEDFFDLLDDEVARDLASSDRNLHRSGGSTGELSRPRNNKYLEASLQVVRGMQEAQGSRKRPANGDEDLSATVEAASNAKNIPKARKMVGYLLQQQLKSTIECHCPPEQGPCPHLPRRCTKPTTRPNVHETVFKKLRAALGNDSFETLMGIRGDVSLIFAIDTTGTMLSEIGAVKNISKAIAMYPREGDVNYILSPFGDPTWGNVYKCSSQESFAEALDTLVAEMGGDCPELTFHGVVDAIERGEPYVGSPMFVFTDAGVKELPSTKYTLDNAVGLALDYMIPVNVFHSTETGSCGSFNQHKTLIQLMDETEGFGLLFNSLGEIEKMDGVVSAALDGTTTILEGRVQGDDSGRLSRSTSAIEARPKVYTIPVDETVGTLIVTFLAAKADHLAALRDPDLVPLPRTNNHTHGGLWIVQNPIRGVWTLLVPPEVGTHTMKVKSSSSFNLEFDFFFVWRHGRGRYVVEWPIDHPLLGRKATVKLIVPLKKRLNISSLVLSLVNEAGDDLISATLAKQSLVGTFSPPDVPFKFKLSGLTKGGMLFQRISRSSIRAKRVALRLQKGLEYSTLTCNSGVTLRFALHYVYSGRQRKSFEITVNSSFPDVHANTDYPSVVTTTLSNRRIYFTVKFFFPVPQPGEPIGNDEWNTFKVTVKKSGSDDERDVTWYTDHLRMICAEEGEINEDEFP